ncbi:MAG: DUF3047 domain-containing protein [Kiloniellales bacterium]
MRRASNTLARVAAASLALALWPLAGFATLEDAGWQTLSLPDRAPARFALRSDGVIEVETKASVGFLYRDVEQAGGRLVWRWRVDKGGPASDLMQRGEDDRPLAVHLWFPEQETSFKDLLAGFFGYPRFGRAITYVWAADGSKGKRFANPYLDPGQGMIIVLRDRSDDLGAWHSETVDYAADYRRHFGTAPPPPKFVAISGDSDDLGGMTLGWVAGLQFQEKPQSERLH